MRFSDSRNLDESDDYLVRAGQMQHLFNIKTVSMLRAGPIQLNFKKKQVWRKTF
jgi:hypothetical protein